MIVYAAVDLRGGRAVQLVGGSTAREKVSKADPAKTAAEWADWGFGGLHVVDLDAALGEGDNSAHIREILSSSRIPVQVGGGVRSDERIAELLDLGAERVVIGTRAVEDQRWRVSATRNHPGRLIVAADLKDGRIVTRGWTWRTAIAAGEFLREIAREPLGAVLVTDVGREGRMDGVDAELFASIVQATGHPVIAAGGIRDADDLRKLRDAGVAGAVVGMALYKGKIKKSDIAELADSVEAAGPFSQETEPARRPEGSEGAETTPAPESPAPGDSTERAE
jgi:phosphoribosylformimino-5-aminoimidazole carboxamide ribotide isomerase